MYIFKRASSAVASIAIAVTVPLAAATPASANVAHACWSTVSAPYAHNRVTGQKMVYARGGVTCNIVANFNVTTWIQKWNGSSWVSIAVYRVDENKTISGGYYYGSELAYDYRCSLGGWGGSPASAAYRTVTQSFYAFGGRSGYTAQVISGYRWLSC